MKLVTRCRRPTREILVLRQQVINCIHFVKVTLGLDDGTNCEVGRGLSGDETVALGLGQAAHEGELVQPIGAHDEVSTK